MSVASPCSIPRCPACSSRNRYLHFCSLPKLADRQLTIHASARSSTPSNRCMPSSETDLSPDGNLIAWNVRGEALRLHPSTIHLIQAITACAGGPEGPMRAVSPGRPTLRNWPSSRLHPRPQDRPSFWRVPDRTPLPACWPPQRLRRRACNGHPTANSSASYM